MKKSILISISFLLSSVLFLHAEAQNLKEQKAESIKKEVDAIFQEMLTYAEQLDYEKLSSGVDDSHGAGFITNKKYYALYSTLIDEFKTNAQGVSRQDISIKEKKITALSDKIVLMTVSGKSNVYLNDGREFLVNFLWSFVFEKMDNSWKVIHSHQSSTS